MTLLRGVAGPGPSTCARPLDIRGWPVSATSVLVVQGGLSSVVEGKVEGDTNRQFATALLALASLCLSLCLSLCFAEHSQPAPTRVIDSCRRPIWTPRPSLPPLTSHIPVPAPAPACLAFAPPRCGGIVSHRCRRTLGLTPSLRLHFGHAQRPHPGVQPTRPHLTTCA